METDERLLDFYLKGFHDELYGSSNIVPDGILLRAYQLGVINAMVGDDVRSVDYLTNEEILNLIKNENTDGSN